MNVRWYGQPKNVKSGYQDPQTKRMKERTVKRDKRKRREARNG